MYRRKSGGNWYITIGGRRVSSGTKDKGRAKLKEGRDNARIWDRREGFVVQTWEEACNSWIDDNPGPWKRPHIQHYMKWWKERLKGKKLTDIGRPLIHGIIAKEMAVDLVAEVPANSTANGYVAFVSRIIEHGTKARPKLIHYPKIKFPKRILKPDEWLKLAEKLDPDSLDAFTYLLATGQREAKGCIQLEWSWIEGNVGTAPTTKMKVPHAYPLNQTALSVIERRRQAQTKHIRLVFTREGGKKWTRKTLCARLHDACTAAGIEDLVPHRLRHAFNTWLAKAGVPKERRKRLLGHAGADTHDGYTHWDVEDLRPDVEVIDRVIALTKRSHAMESA